MLTRKFRFLFVPSFVFVVLLFAQYFLLIPTASAYPDSYEAIKGVNLRSGPGTHYSVLATISRGTRVNVYGIERGWLKIELTNGGYGYSYQSFFSRVGGGSSSPRGNQSNAYSIGYRKGKKEGNKAGCNAGYKDAYTKNYKQSFDDAVDGAAPGDEFRGWSDGYFKWYKKGYERCYRQGSRAGKQDGRRDARQQMQNMRQDLRQQMRQQMGY